MIPDWITWEHGKDLVLLALFVWTRTEIGRNTRLTKRLGKAVDAGNDVTVAIAKKGGSWPPGPLHKAIPRAITLEDDQVTDLLSEAARLDNERKG